MVVLDGTAPSARMFPVREIRKIGRAEEAGANGMGWTAANG